jgi:hypothetical protein
MGEAYTVGAVSVRHATFDASTSPLNGEARLLRSASKDKLAVTVKPVPLMRTAICREVRVQRAT